MIDIIENFYEESDFNLINTSANLNPYNATYQPNDVFYPDRLRAYPCYETKSFAENDKPFHIFCSTFEKKSNLKIKTVKTFFRKILSSELKHVFEYRLSPHKDSDEENIAGVIYINTWNLEDGTYFYSYRNQIKPDIIIGSKPNRCVYYNSNLWHSPGHDKETEVRIIQPFFITLI
jgi:hypothetical protein